MEDIEKIIEGYANLFPHPTTERELRYIKKAYRDGIMESKVKNLARPDVIKCVCEKEIKTGSTSIRCCNICGKPEEEWWR